MRSIHLALWLQNISLCCGVCSLYGNLPRSSNKIRERRLRIAGHCVRHSELEVSNLVLWEPTQGKFNRGSQRLTYVDRLRKDTGLQTTAELKTLMKDKCEWRAIAQGDSTWWWWWCSAQHYDCAVWPISVSTCPLSKLQYYFSPSLGRGNVILHH